MSNRREKSNHSLVAAATLTIVLFAGCNKTTPTTPSSGTVTVNVQGAWVGLANQTSQIGGPATFFQFVQLTQQGTQIEGTAQACADQAATQCSQPPQTGTGTISGRTVTLAVATGPGDPCPGAGTTTFTVNEAVTEAIGTTTGNYTCLGDMTVTYVMQKR